MKHHRRNISFTQKRKRKYESGEYHKASHKWNAREEQARKKFEREVIE